MTEGTEGTKKKQETLPEISSKPIGLVRGGRLGKYRLQKRLGKGGYCEVWKARDCIEGVWVALKIPLIEQGRRDNQNLLREIRLVSQLRHRHIMPVKNADIIQAHAVMATELSVGTLEDRSRPMSAKKIISIILQVLDGLAYAHSKRLVHCDVSPSNIFLLPDGSAALGDFGIGFQQKGRAKTIDEFGTPGYVSPEQAYGKPTFRSDCFSVGLILYEYLTGVLPRWPFAWPFKGLSRLQDKTGGDFVKFIRRALSVNPNKRFANAGQMLLAMKEAIPKSLYPVSEGGTVCRGGGNWRRIRRNAFIKRYGKVLGDFNPCRDCGEPVSESMQVCPWCGSERNRFDNKSRFMQICIRCHKGVLPEWSYCPWCYGAGFADVGSETTKGLRYHDRCRCCGGKVMRYMRYCPWCRRKIRRPWRVRPFPEVCTKCGWSVDSEFWNYCPWCSQKLIIL